MKTDGINSCFLPATTPKKETFTHQVTIPKLQFPPEAETQLHSWKVPLVTDLIPHSHLGAVTQTQSMPRSQGWVQPSPTCAGQAGLGAGSHSSLGF